MDISGITYLDIVLKFIEIMGLNQHVCVCITPIYAYNRVQNNSLTKDIFQTKILFVSQGIFTFVWTKCLMIKLGKLNAKATGLSP